MAVRYVLVLAGLGLLNACTTARATAFDTPKERVTECEQICGSVGLQMSALVIIMNASGCVCERPSAPEAPRAGSASAVSGGAMIAATLAAQQAQQNAQVQAHAGGK